MEKNSLKKIPNVFSKKSSKDARKIKQKEDELYRQIGQFKVELD